MRDRSPTAPQSRWPIFGTAVVDLLGGHAGFVDQPEAVDRTLHQLLSETT